MAAPPAGIDGAWWLVAACFAALLAYSSVGLWDGLWGDEAYSHGPIIAAVVLWLIVRQPPPSLLAPSAVEHASGWLGLSAGVALYATGRTLGIAFIEVSGLIPVAAGLLLIVSGVRGLKAYWFALLFVFFLVPLPDFVLEAATGLLKNKVSYATELILHWAGYPIARSGVMLSIGQYQLLVADACSGLNSLFSLTAMGLLYLHLMRYRSRLRNALLVLGIVPIAVLSNLLRVISLVLITYHAGDERGQGFAHGFAGMFLFVVALLMLYGFDQLLGRAPAIMAAERAEPPARGALPGGRAAHIGCTNEPPLGRTRGRALPLGAKARTARDISASALPRRVSLAALVVLASLAAAATVPRPAKQPVTFQLESMVPVTFAGWQIDPDIVPLTPAPDVQSRLAAIYEQIVARTYVNHAGERVMLTIAYGGEQRGALRSHRQEVCYRAQGFTVDKLTTTRTRVNGRELPVTRFNARMLARIEQVTYWMTMGDEVVTSRFARLLMQVTTGLTQGAVPDGIVVRVSSIDNDANAGYALHQRFLDDLLVTLSPADAQRLTGR